MVAFALLDFSHQCFLPFCAGLLVLGFELEFAVQAFDLDLELQLVLQVGEEMNLEVIKIEAAVEVRLVVLLLVHELLVFKDHISFLPSFED